MVEYTILHITKELMRLTKSFLFSYDTVFVKLLVTYDTVFVKLLVTLELSCLPWIWILYI